MFRRRKLLVLLAVVCAVSVPAAAQTRPRFRFVAPIQQGGGGGGSTNPIDAARRPSTTTAVPDSVWAGAGVSGGIPATYTQCVTAACNTVSGGTVTSTSVNSAIASAPAHTYVLMASGTYTISAGIDFNGASNVILRGAGPGTGGTKLNFTGSVNCHGLGAFICIQGPVPDGETPQNTATVSAGYSKGSAAFTFSSTTGLSAGVLVIVDQQNDSDTDTGNIWVCSTFNVCESDGAPAGASRQTTPLREENQIAVVSSVVGSTVTLSSPIYMPNWVSGKNPGAWWAGGAAITGDGVENVNMDYSGGGSNAGILFMGAYNCWVKNVTSYDTGRNHVWIFESARVTVQHSYFDENQNHGSEAYGVEPFMSSDVLVENTIFHHVTAPILVNGSSSGSVFANNYTLDNTFTNSLTWMIGGGSLHSAGTEMMLFEGNDVNSFEADNVHGTHEFVTYFRNVARGSETGKNQMTMAFSLNAVSRYFNIVGNVAGTSAYTTVYECAAATTSDSCASNADQSIYTLGYAGNEGGSGVYNNDTLTKSTLYRWGNYDTVNAATRFTSGEVPTGLSSYAQPLPSDHTLPSSLYLAAKPSWWPSAITWPAIGPDVTGGDITGLNGHAYKNPAHKCYENATKDGNGKITNYDFNACNYN